MKFVILDVYPNKKHRLIKDTAGGYGTGNDLVIQYFQKFLIYMLTIIKCQQSVFDNKFNTKKKSSSSLH